MSAAPPSAMAMLQRNIEVLFGGRDDDEFRLGRLPVRRSRLVRRLYILLVILAALLFAVRLLHLDADFTTDLAYTGDGVLYTDEGWYAGNAIHFIQTGSWYLPGDLNFAVNLPVLQVLHAISFSVFGLGIQAARLTIIFSFAAVLALVYAMLRRLADPWTALVAVLVVLWNYFFLLYSRLAIAEIPMTMFATASFCFAWMSNHRLGWLWSALSGLCFALAFFTKTSAVFAFPIMAAIIFLQHWKDEHRWAKVLKPIPALVVAAGVYLLHMLLLARPYAADYAYFARLNVGMNLEFDPFKVLQYYLRMVSMMGLMDQPLFHLLVYTVIPMILFARDFRRDPMVWFALAWFGVYTMMFAFYLNPRPRYWVPLFVPLSMLTALLGRHFFLLASRHWSLKVLFAGWIGFLAASLGQNVGMTANYLAHPQYTWRDMAADVRQRMDADGIDSDYLLGHFAMTVALYEPTLLPINSRYAEGPLEDRLERFHPLWLITRDTVYREDSEEEIRHKYPGSYAVRLKALQTYYEPIEQVAVYDTLDDYKGFPLYLYRLHPKAGLGWNAAAHSP